MDWIDVAQDSDRWQAFVNAVMDLRGPLKCEEFLMLSAVTEISFPVHM
jgi:hypothetical protein